MSITAVDVVAREAMVTSDNPLASQVGREILRSGGNAVDAAIGTALALCVVKPSSSGIAGYGGCMVIYLSDGKRVVAVDYNTRAPKAAVADMYELAEGWESCAPGQFPAVPGQKNFIGALAVSVPATIAGLALAEEKFGRLGWGKVLEPATKLAAEGFIVYPGLPENLKGFAQGTDDDSRAVFFPDGRIPVEGETWAQHDLAALLEILAADPHALYRGEPARRIVERVRSMDGILSEEDLAEYCAEVAEPLVFEYRGFRIRASPGLTGSPTALETLAILERLHPGPYVSGDPPYWGDLADALTLAWRDRFAFLGDIADVQERINQLVSGEHAESLAGLIRSGGIRTMPGGSVQSGDTVHVSTCDADRNMVALTQTHGAGWGSRVGVPGLGIVLGHGMSRFDPRPGRPNSISPGKAVLHNMSPIVITFDGEAAGAIGLPGGRMIPSVVAQFVVDLVDFGMTPGEALSHPRIHTEDGPIHATGDLPEAARNAIEERGHQLESVDAIAGLASGLMVGPARIVGAAQAGPEASLGV